MEKKEAIVILWQNGDEKIADIYDTNADVSAALNTLIDGFEYPDHSHKTIQTVLLSYFLKNGCEYRKEMDLGKTLCHHALAHHANEKNIDLMPYFYNHANCNWGILTDDDQISNFVALATKEGRLLSKYKLDDGQDIYLITDFECEEQPRLTTALFTHDY